MQAQTACTVLCALVLGAALAHGPSVTAGEEPVAKSPAKVGASTIHVPRDHKTIQAGIDAAQPGDTVLVGHGTYRERVRLRRGVTLRSVGDDAKGELGLKRAEATILDGGGSVGEGAGVTMAADSTLDGFTVTNVGRYDEGAWRKHHATRGEEQSHEHIGEPGTAGVAVSGIHCTVQGNIVHHIGYTGIAVTGQTGKPTSPQILRNICYRNMGGGIGSMRGSTATIDGNTCFQNFYAGIGHDAASPRVVNNTCYENIRAGIGISEASSPIVRRNKCYRNRRAGIGIRTGRDTRPLVEDNDCYENDMAGIGTREEAAPLIRGNRCYRNLQAGIGSQTGATPLITGNECYENGASGIGSQGETTTTIVGNHCHHNRASGIGFAACRWGRSDVLDNRVLENGKVAIGVQRGWTVRLAGNELSRKDGMPPIVTVARGATATFTDNILRGGGVAGIRVAGDIRVEANRFVGTSLRRKGPPNFAIWAVAGAKVHMAGNTVSGWRDALHADGAEVTVVGNTVREFYGRAFVVRDATRPAVIQGNTVIPTK